MEGGHTNTKESIRRQVILLLLLHLLSQTASEQIRYSIPEELEIGSIVGNLAKDLGLPAGKPANYDLHILSLGKNQYFSINTENGHLYVNSRIDREGICGETAFCHINFEVMIKSPMNIFHITVEIEDINDNVPHFFTGDIKLETIESTFPGARFVLGYAKDADVGINSLQNYHLMPNQYFILETREREDGNKYAEIVLNKQLDRESESSFHLILTALDGGKPTKTGTATIWVNVLDANDNSPIFAQEVYKVSLKENAAKGSSVVQVKATDKDEGSNGQIDYQFANIPESAHQRFSVSSVNGTITVTENLDFEEMEKYTLTVEARDGDGGGLVTHCKVEITILDENDNAPEIMLASLVNPVSEDTALGAVIAYIIVTDKDTGDNGKVTCHLHGDPPFRILPTSSNYYKLLSDGPLDRERTPEYNITVTASDAGSPPLSTHKSITLQVSDVNDNAPAFETLVIMLKLRQSGSPKFLQCFAPIPHSNNTLIFPPNYEEGTLPYSYQLCLSSESRIHEFAFPKPPVPTTEIIPCTNKSDTLMMINGDNAPNPEMGNGEVVSFLSVGT
ncbi:protocadherin gamma-B4-like [Varanus komodoensis]|uniref:protocadherin gamma-B4-like n=1 Tax=Varanus komodoensis TaxID=61221 RepID=UPI001CF7CA31|nr:protocadherin gamma-B4-like [Varanus komodoensis]